ncbi:MAG: hypothetical protein CMH46_06585 [Muricauda sp.]|nr:MULTISPECIES: hypothetical protein [unclassified Allomuricauda]MAU15193.1 hypothetical protein [Allomuricauda sp.]|tara:strand:- start:35 stop:421 length:387 start_codon:yes stop_codon:yes gene_type:complete
MENSARKEMEKSRKEMFAKIGKRLRELRIQENLRHSDIQDELKLKLNVLHRIEFGKGGSIENFIDIVQYFVDKGYNLNWIMAKDNSMEFKSTNQQVYYEFDKVKLVEQAKQLVQDSENLLRTIEKTTS